MDIKANIRKQIESLDTDKIRTDCLRTARIWGWRSGLGSAMNSASSLLGQQLVVCFADKVHRLPLYYFTNEGETLAVIPPADIALCRECLLSSSAVELWMKAGWFSGNAAFVDDNERQKLLETLTPEMLYGQSANLLNYPLPEECEFLRIMRSAPCTGEKGPGEYSWVWAASTLFFFTAWIGKSNNKKSSDKHK